MSWQFVRQELSIQACPAAVKTRGRGRRTASASISMPTSGRLRRLPSPCRSARSTEAGGAGREQGGRRRVFHLSGLRKDRCPPLLSQPVSSSLLDGGGGGGGSTATRWEGVWSDDARPCWDVVGRADALPSLPICFQAFTMEVRRLPAAKTTCRSERREKKQNAEEIKIGRKPKQPRKNGNRKSMKT